MVASKVARISKTSSHFEWGSTMIRKVFLPDMILNNQCGYVTRGAQAIPRNEEVLWQMCFDALDTAHSSELWLRGLALAYRLPLKHHGGAHLKLHQ